MDDHQFARLLDFFNYSWKGYRKVRKGVKKRVSRHMQELGCRNVDDYLERIKTDNAIQTECKRRMTVSISRFFRDRLMWQILEEQILPELTRQGRFQVGIWFAGCAGGEEVYSFKMVWEAFKTRNKQVPGLLVIATDINPVYLERAQKGIYPPGTLREVDESRRSFWFERYRNAQYAVKLLLKEGIDWRVHDFLIDNPPASDFDIVFLRNNLLTYYPGETIQRPLERIIDALSPSGFLVIGAKEEMPWHGLTRLSRFSRYVFRKT